MLPGFRFLFAATALTMSIVVFGLGAVALLRAAHEEFASIPSWRATPETMFAAPNEASPPVLAMLRIEPPATEQKSPDNFPATLTPAEPTATVSTAVEPETTTAPRSDDLSAPVPETAKSENPVAESPTRDEAAPAQAEAPVPASDIRLAANEAVSSAPSEVVPSAAEPMSAPIAPQMAATKPEFASTKSASTKIATLGAPPVAIEALPPPKAAPAKPDKDAIKKRLQAQQALARRRAALRARLVQQQAPQQTADPFAQPAAQPVATARRR
jgi:hypothetical protein